MLRKLKLFKRFPHLIWRKEADGKEERHWIKVGEKVTIGAYVVELPGAYPFGKTNAELVVTRH